MLLRTLSGSILMAAMMAAQPQSTDPAPAAAPAAAPAEVPGYKVDPGTRVPLNLINSVSTKNADVGTRVYLETAFPIVVDSRVVIPPGSYVAGTVTEVKRPGRMKGKGEIYLRFDSLTLPNGVTRDFRARVSGVDGLSGEKLDKKEGKVVGDGNKGGDARTVGETAVTGTWIGTIAGAAAGRPGMGAGVGAAAGAAAGMVGVLLSRGPDAVLAKGTTIEMVLDRPLFYEEQELDFGPGFQRPGSGRSYAPAQQQKRTSPIPGMGRRPILD